MAITIATLLAEAKAVRDGLRAAKTKEDMESLEVQGQSLKATLQQFCEETELDDQIRILAEEIIRLTDKEIALRDAEHPAIARGDGG